MTTFTLAQHLFVKSSTSYFMKTRKRCGSSYSVADEQTWSPHEALCVYVCKQRLKVTIHDKAGSNISLGSP